MEARILATENKNAGRMAHINNTKKKD